MSRRSKAAKLALAAAATAAPGGEAALGAAEAVVAARRHTRKHRGLLPAALLVYHHVGYPLLLWAWDAGRQVTTEGAPLRVGPRHRDGGGPLDPAAPPPPPELPMVALIIPAHNESQVIRRKIATALELDYPRELLRIIVAADGCTDDTVQAARDAGADVVLDLPRGGKMAAQHAAMAEVTEPIVAFSDANSRWQPQALRALVDALHPPRVGYACGHVRFLREDDDGAADNQEGLYWRYEMAIRTRESRLASVTAGNGAIYAIKRAAYRAYAFDPRMGHDLAMPFQLVRAGWLAVDCGDANATELMVPTIDGEARRKRRMMRHVWTTVLRGGMLDLRGLPPRYALMLVSHRWLRYAAPLIHGWLALASLRGARRSRTARLFVAAQLGILAAAAKPELAPAGPARKIALLCRYYVSTNAAIALGLRDHLVDGTEGHWTPPEGTR